MKKEGFTLIELLAIIVIISILVLLAVPGVTGLINNSKKDLFKSEAITFIHDFDNAYVKKMSSRSAYGTTKGKVSILSHDLGDGEKEYYYLCMELNDLVGGKYTNKTLSSDYKGYVETYVDVEDQSTHTFVSITNGNYEIVASESELKGENYQVKGVSGSGVYTCSASLTLYNGVEHSDDSSLGNEDDLNNNGGSNNGESDNGGSNNGGSNNGENSNNEEDTNYPTLMAGPDMNAKVEEMLDNSGATSVRAFIKTTTAPTASDNYINVAAASSSKPIYLWLKDRVVYIYSDSKKIYMNSDSSKLFYNFYSDVTSLDMSYFDTSKVEYMSYMFYKMENLTELDLSNFDTSKVRYMTGMFGLNRKLKKLNISSFNTHLVVHMGGMFGYMQSITDLDLSNFDTSNVVYMIGMFNHVNVANNFNISSFDTSYVEDMYLMFSGFEIGSKVLDLSNFDTKYVINMKKMFANSNVETIYVSNKWVTNPDVDNYDQLMFENNPNLKGGAGTRWDYRHSNWEYARIDDPGNGKPGYFTLKTT